MSPQVLYGHGAWNPWLARYQAFLQVAGLALGLVIAAGNSVVAAETPLVGPTNGTLVIVGGGGGQAIMKRFIDLAGGSAALIAVVPTAGDAESYGNDWSGLRSFRSLGATNLVVIHTRDRAVADSEAFVEPLTRARAVWFGGGRHWRFVDSYLGTRTEREFARVLDRGGVIGGSSAGATIQGSYLVRGAREGNHIMMAPGYEIGFGYLRNAAIDQHLIARKRENDLVPVVKKHPELLGIGLDESTAIVVTGDTFEVMGASKVAIYDPRRTVPDGERFYYFLNAGDRFDLRARKPVK